MKKNKVTKSSKSRSSLFILLVLCLAVGLVFLVNYAYSQKHKSSPISNQTSTLSKSSPENNKTSSPNTVPSTGSSTSKNENSTSTTTSNTNNSSSVNLISPWGNFVSNPSPSNSYPDNQEESVCNTSSGVTCTITFTQGSKTITLLKPETTDSNGAAYWGPWTASQVGLNSGTWQITATASYGNQSKSSNGGTIDIQ